MVTRFFALNKICADWNPTILTWLCSVSNYQIQNEWVITIILFFFFVTFFCRFEGITIVRNGGRYGAVSANWSISRNSTDTAPLSDDLAPAAGTVKFAAGQVTAVIPINIVADVDPEEAEAFILRLLPDTVTGNAEVDEPMEVSLKDKIRFSDTLHVAICFLVVRKFWQVCFFSFNISSTPLTTYESSGHSFC